MHGEKEWYHLLVIDSGRVSYKIKCSELYDFKIILQHIVITHETSISGSGTLAGAYEHHEAFISLTIIIIHVSELKS